MHKEPSKLRLVLLMLALPGTLYAPVEARAAGGAYLVDDADIAKPGACQLESWTQFSNRQDFVGVTSPACVVQLGIPVELTTLFQRSRINAEWTTTAGAQAKIVPVNTDRFAFGLSAGTSWDLTVHENAGGFLNVPLTFKFGKDFRVHVNGGWLYNRLTDIHYATGGVGFEWDFIKQWSLQGEIYDQVSGRASTPASTERPRLQLGLRYMPVKTIDVDFIYGHNITGHGAHWFTLGLSLRSE